MSEKSLQSDLSHAQTTGQLGELLRPHEDALALLIVGSLAAGQGDRWSDIDALLVVADDAFARYFPSIQLLQRLGPLLGYEQAVWRDRGTTRAVLVDGRRIDLIVASKTRFAQDNDWPLRDGVRVIFSRSAEVDAQLAQPLPPAPPPHFSDEQFTAFANAFWFKATLALVKVLRGDLLIGLHLCLEVVQETCVLAMILRDRAEGTTIHKTGGIGNILVQQVQMPVAPGAEAILASLAQSAQLFDTLASQWSAHYTPRSHTFISLIELMQHKEL